MPFFLERLDKTPGNNFILLDGDIMTVGSCPNATVRVSSPSISSCHAILIRDNKTWMTKEANVFSSVFVNNVRLQSETAQTLKDKDVICLGPPQTGIKFRFRIKGSQNTAFQEERTPFHSNYTSEQDYQEDADILGKGSTGSEELGKKLPEERNDHDKADVLNTIGNVMESELMCSICTELFIHATTLNCSHTFCHSCIESWKKKNNICPICRTFIKTLTRSVVLDNFIEKMLENFIPEAKKRRQLLMDERNRSVPWGNSTSPGECGFNNFDSSSDPEMIFSSNYSNIYDEDFRILLNMYTTAQNDSRTARSIFNEFSVPNFGFGFHFNGP